MSKKPLINAGQYYFLFFNSSKRRDSSSKSISSSLPELDGISGKSDGTFGRFRFEKASAWNFERGCGFGLEEF